MKTGLEAIIRLELDAVVYSSPMFWILDGGQHIGSVDLAVPVVHLLLAPWTHSSHFHLLSE
jgi:hypothetical protein